MWVRRPDAVIPIAIGKRKRMDGKGTGVDANRIAVRSGERDRNYFPSTENASSTLPGIPPHWP
jgi:hypothetical protein